MQTTTKIADSRQQTADSTTHLIPEDVAKDTADQHENEDEKEQHKEDQQHEANFWAGEGGGGKQNRNRNKQSVSGN